MIFHMIKVLISNSNRSEVQMIHQVLQQLSGHMHIPIAIEGFLSPSEKHFAMKQTASSAYDYDLIFLNLDDSYNCSYGMKLRGASQHPAIILSSADIERVREYARLRPSMFYTDMKDMKVFAKQLAKIIHEMEYGTRCFILKNSDEIQRIPFDSILYFETDHRNMILHTLDIRHTYCFPSKIEHLMTVLPEQMFIRCHQSYIVNRTKIKSVNRITKQFVLVSGDVVDISRRNYQQAVELFANGGASGQTEQEEKAI